jgi:hypothetical protein
MQKKLIIIFLSFFINPLNSQIQWNSNKDKITIPFELSNNLIIIKVKINAIDLNMILDTGSEKNILFSFPENDSITFHNSRKINLRGLGFGETLDAYISTKNTFSVNKLVDTNFEVLLVTDQDINIINKLGIPINGIVGSSFFKNYIIEINYQTHKIFFYKNEEFLNKRKYRKYSSEHVSIISNKPYIDMQANINEKLVDLKLLMDSGMGDGLWVFENDSISSSKAYFNDVLGRGLGGDIFGKRSRISNLIINEFHFKNALVSFPDSISINRLELVKDRNGSIGGDILKRFNWVFDYTNGKVYFKKNSNFDLPFNYNMSGIEIQHKGSQVIKEVERKNLPMNQINIDEHIFDDAKLRYNYKYELKPIFEIYSIREDSPAKRAGLLEGDRIISINGKKGYSYTIQKITDLFQSEEGKNIIIEVERDGFIFKFKFKLEKIL